MALDVCVDEDELEVVLVVEGPAEDFDEVVMGKLMSGGVELELELEITIGAEEELPPKSLEYWIVVRTFSTRKYSAVKQSQLLTISEPTSIVARTQ